MGHRPLRLSLRLALAGASIAFVCSAQAQIFTGAAPKPAVAMPAAAAPAPVAPKTILRFMPNTLGGLRLTGEVGDIHWPVAVTAAQARTATRFRVGYLSAVSVLPESSRLEVRINDTLIGAEAIDAPQGLKTVEFEIPAGLLVPGFNAISLSVQQRHRVDCSVAATYELWSKIDPAETGLMLAGDTHGIADVADVPALLPKADGTLPIHIVLATKTNPRHLQRLVAATQYIALAGHFLQPAVDFKATSDDAFGLNLALGTRDVLSHVPQISTSLGNAGPLVKIVTVGAIGRPTLIVTGSTDDEVDQALAALAAGASPQGSPAGLAFLANYPAMRTNGGTTLSLRDLGLKSQDFNGRMFRKSVDLRLPGDFLASDYGRGTFDLAGGYAAGLVRGSQVRVDINGRSAGVIKLPFADGDIFKHNQLFLPLSLMRPGLNRIDIIAETPRPEDAACADAGDRRFLLLDNSAVTLPVLAHVQRLPDLGVTSAGGLPFTRGTAHLVVPKPDRETVAAALSITARAAVAAGKPIVFAFSTRMPTEDDGSTLVVAPARQLDPAVMTSIGLDTNEVEKAWHDLADVKPVPSTSGGAPLQQRWWLTSTDGPSACRLPAQVHPAAIDETATAPAPVSTPPRPAESDDLLEVWTGERRAAPGWRERIVKASTSTVGWARDLVKSVHLPRSAPHRDAVTIDASLVLAQGMSNGSRVHTTTIVTAPDSAMLHDGLACLFDPQVWSQVHGRLAVLDGATGAITATDATSYKYVAAEEPSLANSRLVLAGWFSLNPIAFALVALLTALCLSGTTLWFVRGIGRRSE